MRKKTFQIKAEGNSMYPILQNGDVVEYIQTPFSLIRLNDIILVYSNSILVTHRVLYKTKKTCITRGDNNREADVDVQKGKVLAKVVRFKRGGVWHDIQDVYRVQSTLYLNEIQKLESVLRIKSIPHVFLKGVLISLRYEESIPKRIYADCDVLVRREDYKKIHHVFKALGYSVQERPFWQPRRLTRLKIQPEESFMKVVSGVPVVFDVHFEPVFLMTQLGGMHLLYPRKLLVQLGENIIKKGEVKKINGYKYSLCSAGDQILYLALHIFHHNFTDCIRYQLLDSVIRKRFDDWESLAQTIKEYRLEGYIYGVFILLKKYYKTPISSAFINTICSSRYTLHVARFAINKVDIFSQENRTKAGIARFILIFLLSPESFLKKTLLFFHPEVLHMGIKLVSSIIMKKISDIFTRK